MIFSILLQKQTLVEGNAIIQVRVFVFLYTSYTPIHTPEWPIIIVMAIR